MQQINVFPSVDLADRVFVMICYSFLSVISSEIKGKNSCKILHTDKSNSNLSS